jgi:hypothetical protein
MKLWDAENPCASGAGHRADSAFGYGVVRTTLGYATLYCFVLLGVIPATRSRSDGNAGAGAIRSELRRV